MKSVFLFALLCLPPAAASADDLVYVRRDTRAASREASIAATAAKLGPFRGGTWMSLVDMPFPQGSRGEVDTTADATAPGRRHRWQPCPQLQDGAWGRLTTDVAWLYRRIESDRDADATFVFGSAVFFNSWFNGENREAFGNTKVLPDGVSRFSVRVRKGVNHVLVRLAGPKEFYFDLSPVTAAHLAELERRLEADFPGGEGRYWRLESLPTPEGTALEVGGLAFRSDGTLYICTRRGEIWAVRDLSAAGAVSINNRTLPVSPNIAGRLLSWTRFAYGLHEALGICAGDAPGELYVIQRPELTRVRDVDGDGAADRFETVADAWGISGNHHEYQYGAVRDKEGNFWGAISGLGDVGHARYLGWSYKVTPKGEFVLWSRGLRSSNGVGVSPDGEVFITDNQGEFVGTSAVHHVTQGAFHGHPVALFWDKAFEGRNPIEAPIADLDRMRKPAALLFPYGPMGQSIAQPVWDLTAGKFGPFAGQMFVGDQTKCTVMRATLEKVGGEWQGACYPFRSGFQCGVNRIAFAPDGSLWAGETDRGWGAIGGKPWGLERLVWTGDVPMEIREMRLARDGFDLEFTKPVDPATAQDPGAWSLQRYHYLYHHPYGSPQAGNAAVEVRQVRVSDDRKRVGLVLSELVAGEIYELNVKGLRAADGTELLHPAAYYTLNRKRGD